MADSQDNERIGDVGATHETNFPCHSNATIQNSVAPVSGNTDASFSPPAPVRAQLSASSLMAAAEIDAVLLSLSPSVMGLSRQSAKTSTLRAISDSMLVATPGAAASIDSKPLPGIDTTGPAVQATYSPKRRRSTGFASVGKRVSLEEKFKDGFLDVFGLLGILMVFAFVFSG
uniref:Uncharacterized protein n=1 Tax=Globisporangium ultimum (strain ATCC 200006 / CBS 805.95 / DAOM BR144) TaxID=431595 RepID=K3WC99_GLOUD